MALREQMEASLKETLREMERQAARVEKGMCFAGGRGAYAWVLHVRRLRMSCACNVRGH